MQTFLPYPSLQLSIQILDNKRLCKQIVEAYQILTLRVPTKNHPAVMMWHGYEECLCQYILYACEEYSVRYSKMHSIYEYLLSKYSIDGYIFNSEFKYPPWFKKAVVFLSHKVNLLRKDFEWYSKYFICDKLHEYPEGYYWPMYKGNVSKMHTENWIKFMQIK